MNLEPFNLKDAKQLIEWISSEELNHLWGGPTYVYPLTHQQISSHCTQDEVFPYIFKVEGKTAGFVELFCVTSEHYRICRVFISNDFRGKGLAKLMLKEVINTAIVEFNAKLLSLAVFKHNTVARYCYESLGFMMVSEEVGTRLFGGKLWELVLMEKRF